MRLPYELYSSLRYLRFYSGRTCLLVSGVGIGTAALVIALSLNTGFQEDVRERILTGNAHLTVMSSLYSTFGGAEAVVGVLQEIPGVHSAGPVLYTPAMITTAGLESNPAYAEVQGVDPGAHSRVVHGTEEAGGAFAALARSSEARREGIVLGEQLAIRLGVLPGDRVRLIVPSVRLTPFGPVPRSHVFEMVGTYRSDFFQEDAQRAYISLSAARRMLRAEGLASWIEIRLDDLRRLEGMKATLRETLGASWQVFDLIEENQGIIKALNWEKLILFLAIGLIVVVAAVNILSTLVLMVTNKIKEIGILSAMGARPWAIAKVFMLQGLIIGVIGAVIGLVFGTSISFLFDRYHLIKLSPEVYYLTYVPFTTRGVDLVFVAILALLTSLLATLYPAWRASKLDPVEALRYE